MSASSHDEEKRPVNTAAATENDTQPTEAAQPTDADEKGKSKTTVSVADNWHPPKKTRLKSAILIAIGLVAIGLVLYAWKLPPFQSAVVRTDNAYVRGQTTVISPQVTGYVTRVYVQDFEDVAAGTPLVQIDPRIYQQKVEQAHAQVLAAESNLNNNQQSLTSNQSTVIARNASIANAEALLKKAQADMARVQELVGLGSLSPREGDQARAALQQAQAAVAEAHAQKAVAEQGVKSTHVGKQGLQAAVAQAQAQEQLAQIDLNNTTIKAPQQGRLSEISVKQGQLVNAGTQLMYLVPKHVWVVANFKETQTANIKVGQAATVRVDALGGAELRGKVERIAPAAGSEFSVIRPDNATGNFVKVAQRIAVRIQIDPNQELATRLSPGMSVEASVDTGSKP
jgi:multidrug resistance efflux pump